MAKKKYTVVYGLTRNGKDIGPGKEITMDDKEAEDLVACGQLILSADNKAAKTTSAENTSVFSEGQESELDADIESGPAGDSDSIFDAGSDSDQSQAQ